jgi:hypothetical protein
MALAWRIGVCTFRTLNDPLSGELCVQGSARRSKRARGRQNPAEKKPLASCAGSDDGDGPTDGEGAHTSAAHAAGSEPCADSAETNGSVMTRALKEGSRTEEMVRWRRKKVGTCREMDLSSCGK